MAVLLRRGPSKLVQCLLWNLETDEVTPGQWFKGRIYEHRCDLSPDGKLFVYFAANHKGQRWDEGSWTAISRPPYLTALALWFKGDCWDGGGIFDSNWQVRINGLRDHRYAKEFAAPKVKVGSLGERRGEDWPIERDRRVRDGWQVVQDLDASITHPTPPPPMDATQTPGFIEKIQEWLNSETSAAFGNGFTTHQPRVMNKAVGKIAITETYSIRRFTDTRVFTGMIGGSEVDLSGARQVDIDSPRSRIVYSVSGKVFAADGISVKEICDLTDHHFEPVPPTDWAQQWP